MIDERSSKAEQAQHIAENFQSLYSHGKPPMNDSERLYDWLFNVGLVWNGDRFVWWDKAAEEKHQS
jgi:hypothetical protein